MPRTGVTPRSRWSRSLPEIEDDHEIRSTTTICASTPIARPGRRSARQQDVVGRAHHAPADGHRRHLSERALPDPEPRERDEDPARPLTGAEMNEEADERSRIKGENRVGQPHPLLRAPPIRIKDLRTGVESDNPQRCSMASRSLHRSEPETRGVSRAVSEHDSSTFNPHSGAPSSRNCDAGVIPIPMTSNATRSRPICSGASGIQTTLRSRRRSPSPAA